MAVTANSHDEGQTDYRSAQASQVIFTNVEENDSPRGKRGFQTVFLTQPELSWESVLHEIESSLQYYPRAGFANVPDAEKPREHVFFTTSTGQIAVVCISPLLDEMDRFNRPKMLFAHVLLFEADDFAREFGNDPFLIFEQHHFFCSFEEVTRSGMTSEDGHIEQVTVSVDINCRESLSPQFAKLEQDSQQVFLTHLLASHAANPRGRRFSLQFDGPAGSMYVFLQSLFPFLPISLRTAWSFDTLFVGGTGESKQTESPHWANGVEPGQILKQKNSRVISFNMETAAFEFDVESFQPETPYEFWLVCWMKKMEGVPLGDTLQDAFNMQQLCWGRSIPTWAEPDRTVDIFEMFFDANRDYLTRMLTKNLSKYPGGGLESSLIQRAISWIKIEGFEALRYIPRKLPKARLCQWLLHSTRNGDYQDPTEIEAIRQFAVEAIKDKNEEYSPTAFLLTGTLAAVTENWEVFVRVLAQLSDSGFQQMARWTLGRCNETWCEFDTTTNEENGASRFVVTCPTRGTSKTKNRISANSMAALLGMLLTEAEERQGKGTVRVLRKKSSFKQLRKNWPTIIEIIAARNTAERNAGQGIVTPVKRASSSDDWMDSLVETRTGNGWEQELSGQLEERCEQYILERNLKDPSKQRCWCSPAAGAIAWKDAVRYFTVDPKHIDPNVDSPIRVFMQVSGSEGPVIIAETRRTADSSQQPCFLTHAIALDFQTFRHRYANNPFSIFDSDCFAKQAPPTSQASDGIVSEIDTFILPTPAPEVCGQWSQKLFETPLSLPVILTCAHRLSVFDIRNIICFEGSSQDLDDFLRELFAIVPSRIRIALSFHSCFAGKFEADEPPFMAVCRTPESQQPTPKWDMLSFNVRKVRFDHPVALHERSVFERWLKAAFEQGISRRRLHEEYEYAHACSDPNAGAIRIGKNFGDFVSGLIQPLIANQLNSHLMTKTWKDVFVPELRKGELAHFSSEKDSKTWIYQCLAEWMMKAEPRDIELDAVETLLMADKEDSPERRLLECIGNFYRRIWYMVAEQVRELPRRQFTSFARWALESLSQDELKSLTWTTSFTNRGDVEFGVEVSINGRRTLDVVSTLFGEVVHEETSRTIEGQSKQWQILLGLLEKRTNSSPVQKSKPKPDKIRSPQN